MCLYCQSGSSHILPILSHHATVDVQLSVGLTLQVHLGGRLASHSRAGLGAPSLRSQPSVV